MRSVKTHQFIANM